MKKTAVQAFLNMLGYKVEDKHLVRKDEDFDDVPDGEEEEVVANALPPQFQKGKQPDNTGQQSPPKEPGNTQTPDNTALLNQLIDDIGGFETFKAVLLAAVEMGKMGQAQTPQPSQNVEAEKRNGLIAKIVANSADAISAKDLSEIPTNALEIMAKNAKVVKPTDYSALAPSSEANQNAKRPTRPAFLLAQKT